MNRDAIGIDLGLAVIAAIVVFVLSPGVAVTALLALLVLAVCGLSLVFDASRKRGRRRPR